MQNLDNSEYLMEYNANQYHEIDPCFFGDQMKYKWEKMAQTWTDKSFQFCF